MRVRTWGWAAIAVRGQPKADSHPPTTCPSLPFFPPSSLFVPSAWIGTVRSSPASFACVPFRASLAPRGPSSWPWCPYPPHARSRIRLPRVVRPPPPPPLVGGMRVVVVVVMLPPRPPWWMVMIPKGGLPFEDGLLPCSSLHRPSPTKRPLPLPHTPPPLPPCPPVGLHSCPTTTSMNLYHQHHHHRSPLLWSSPNPPQ